MNGVIPTVHGDALFFALLLGDGMKTDSNSGQGLNPMAYAPVKSLMLKMGIPMILSMALQAVYNIVDSAFVSNMAVNGELALNALTLAFPVQILMVAVGIGTGVGTNVLVSKTLGQGDREKAGRIAGNGMFLSFLIYILFALFGFFGVGVYVDSQTSDPVISGMAKDYLFICCVFSMGIVFFSIFEKLLQSTGKSVLSTAAQVTGAIVNIVMDPIMIYGLLGCLEMGVKGAAWATVMGQVSSFLIGLAFHYFKNREIPFGIKYMKPSLRIFGSIYSIGLPAIIAQALMSVMTYGLNIILVALGSETVTAYGLFYKIQQFVLFCAFGLRDAIMPIVAFNYGKEDQKRVSDGIRYGVLYTLVIMVAGTAALEIFALPLARAFGLSGLTESLSISAMRIISISFVFAGANIALQGVFQALGDGMASLIISVLRQIILVLPVAWILTRAALMNPEHSWIVWTTFVFSELVSMLVSIAMLRRMGKFLE